MNWIEKLRNRWQVKSGFQVILILIVFACTGTTVAAVARPFLRWAFSPEEVPFWAHIIYYILILPFYNIFLLMYGFLFGQFSFFWTFEKRFFQRILKMKEKTNPKNQNHEE